MKILIRENLRTIIIKGAPQIYYECCSSKFYDMKFLYNGQKFLKECDVDNAFQYPITYFIEIPVLFFSNHAMIKIGTIDLVYSKEYNMPIQIGNVIFRDFELFKEKASFLCDYSEHSFIKANIQLVLHKEQYNSFSYEIKNSIFEYIRTENIVFFLNEVISLLNWGIKNNKDLDLIFLFSVLLCKKEIITDLDTINTKRPYVYKGFLNDLTVKQDFKFVSRVGRDDYSYEYTHFIFVPNCVEEYYLVKLIGKEMAEDSCYPKLKIKMEGNLVDIVFCSMHDTNAYRSEIKEYTTENFNAYKKIVIESFEKLYESFWNSFMVLFNEYKNSNSKSGN